MVVYPTIPAAFENLSQRERLLVKVAFESRSIGISQREQLSKMEAEALEVSISS